MMYYLKIAILVVNLLGPNVSHIVRLPSPCIFGSSTQTEPQNRCTEILYKHNYLLIQHKNCFLKQLEHNIFTSKGTQATRAELTVKLFVQKFFKMCGTKGE